MNSSGQLMVFTLDGQRYALPLSAVERVIRMMEVTPLPKAPESVTGIINLHGSILPVFNLRGRFGLMVREYELTDLIVIARTRKRRVALPVDRVSGVIPSAGYVEADAILPDHPYLQGVVKFPDGLILIHDPDTFLSLDEEAALDDALPSGGG